MVHGGGSCSSGGGGGGGYSHSSNHTYVHISTSNNSRGHRVNGHRQEFTCNDCKGTFICLGLCCGCRGKNHVQRMFRIWAWLFIIALVTGLAVGFGGFGPKSVPASPTDMIPITNGIHSSFCHGVDIDTTIPVSVFLLLSTPAVSATKVKYVTTQTALIAEDRYEYWGFYLLSGSKIELEVCGDRDGDMYIIKGDGNFDSWKEDNYNVGTYKKTVRTKACVSPHHDATKIQFSVTVTGEYYLVLTNHNYKPLSASITFLLDRTVYDLGQNTKFCSNTTHCHVDLAGENESKSIVVYVPETDDFDFNVKTACLRRNEVFIYIFLLIPLVIGFLATGYFVCIKCRLNVLSRARSQQESHIRASCPSAKGYQAIPNVVRNEPSAPPLDDVDPPSYDEAVKYQKR